MDYFDYRLSHSRKLNQTEVFDFTQYDDMCETLKELTKGGADVVIDCVGMDGKKSTLEYVEQKLKLQGGTLGPIQIVTKAVRKCGTVQITGVYGGLYNRFPLEPLFSRNITLKMRHVHARSYMSILYQKNVNRQIDPKAIIIHTLPLEEATHAYSIFNNKQDNYKSCFETLKREQSKSSAPLISVYIA